jgi:hypothetical protein
MLHLCYEDRVELKDIHPALFNSILRIYAYHTPKSSKREEALSNMMISCRGSIRKAPNIVTIAKMTRTLKAFGDEDYASFLKTWNARAPKAHQVTGSKAVGLKLILECAPNEVLDMILHHVGNQGWKDCAFSEDCLGTKKIYPGYQFPAKGKRWQSRLKTSVQSMTLHIERVIAENENSLPHMRKKTSKQEMEKGAERASAVYAIGQEVLQSIMNSTVEMVERFLYKPYKANAMGIEVEVNAAILEKLEIFNIRELSAVKDIINQVSATNTNASSLVQSMSATVTEIEIDSFKLVMKQINHDIDVIRVWKQKHLTFESSLYFKKKDWISLRMDELESEAKKLMSLYAKFSVTESVELTTQLLTSFKRSIGGKLSCPSDNIVSIPICNWCAPCSIPSAQQEIQGSVMTWCMYENDKSAGVIMMPTFVHKKGQLWLAERACTDIIHRGSIFADMSAMLVFKNKTDARDERPMSYPLKLILPSNIDVKKSEWRSNALMTMGRTKEVDQLRGSEMIVIEDVSLDCLPSSDDHVGAQGPGKYEQVGVDAMRAVLQAQLDNADLSKFDALLIIDMRVKYCNTFMAFLSTRNLYNKPLYYFGLCENMVELQWAEQYVTNMVANKLGNGEITGTAGFKPKPLEMPQEAYGEPPQVPTLTKLIMGGPNRKQPQMPPDLIKQYATHERFGIEFEALLASFHEEFGQAEADVPTHGGDDKTPLKKKRGASTLSEAGTPMTSSKKLKVDPSMIVETASIDSELKFECNLTNFKGGDMKLQIREGDKLMIVNVGTHEASLPAHSWLVGLPKGQFKLVKKA